MAITRAQQAKQMLQDGGMLVSPSKDGKRPGYRSAKSQKSKEQKSRADPRSVGFSAAQAAANVGKTSTSPTRETSNYTDTYRGPADLGVTTRKKNRITAPPATTRIGGIEYEVTPDNVYERQEAENLANLQKQQEINQFINRPPKPIKTPFPIVTTGLNALQNFLPYKLNREFYAKNVIGKTYIDEDGNVKTFGLDADSYDDYDRLRKEGIINPYGRELSDFERGTGPYEGQDKPITVRDDDENNDGDGDGDGDGNTNRERGLALRFMNRGGMPMDAPTEGGIMDLETGRQMYFLGKLVKKATRAVKKIVKSPIGKAAMLYFGGNALMGKGGLGKFLLGTKGVGMDGGLPGFLFDKGLIKGGFGTFGGLTGKGMLGVGGGLLALLPFLSDEEKQQVMDRGKSLDIGYIRDNPYTFKSIVGSGRGLGFNFADGGRIGYQEGSKEPVAKKTMPLLDMGGKEMDLREDGGFVPIGRMEKADDVPARLSKNEFVFTADAVRNAGDGDVDKGAEVMYNMMKNLESGGDVSEESQGLEGARRMFQTSKRLEEVL